MLLSILSIANFVVFMVQERRSSSPMLDLTLFKNRQFSGSSLAYPLQRGIVGRGFYPPQSISATGTWADSTANRHSADPFPAAVLSVGPLSGRFSDKFGRIPFTVTGLILQGTAVYLFSTLTRLGKSFDGHRVHGAVRLWHRSVQLADFQLDNGVSPGR